MSELEISFKNDLADLTSPSNFIIGIIVPVTLAIIINKENPLLNAIIFLFIIIFLIIIYFCIKWVLFYRKEKPIREKINNPGEIKGIEERLEKMYRPIQRISFEEFPSLVKELYDRQHLAHDELKKELIYYCHNLSAPNLLERHTRIINLANWEVQKLEKKLEELRK